MKATQRFIFVNKNNYKQQLATQTAAEAVPFSNTVIENGTRNIIPTENLPVGSSRPGLSQANEQTFAERLGKRQIIPTENLDLTLQNTQVMGNVPSQPTNPNVIMRDVVDSFRQTIGNYWFPRLPNGKPAQLLYSGVNPKATLAWHEKKDFPFTIQLGKTHTFSTYKTIPTAVKMTTVTLVADDIFSPYPGCAPCWFRYLYGYDMDDPTKIVDKVFGFSPLKIQDIESKFTINDPTLASDPVQQQKIGSLTPLSMLLLTDAGLPTTERLARVGIDISYLSFGDMLVQAIKLLSIGVDPNSPVALSYSAKVYKDSVFDSDIATLTDVEESIESGVDFTLNASVDFVHNYTAREYENSVQTDRPSMGLNLPGGETKLVNMYEAILNKMIEPTILKLRGEMDCFKQNLVLFFRPKGYPYDSKIIYTLAETLPLINKFYPFETLLPYHSKINFTLQPTGPIGAAVEETRNDGMLMRYLQENESVRLSGISSGNKVFKQTVGSKKKNKKFVSLLVQENNNVIRTWGFYEWMLKLGERLNNIRSLTPGTPNSVDPIPSDSIILNSRTKSSLATAGMHTPITNYALSLAAVHSKVADIIKFNSRSYPELLRGDRPYKEVIAYKIEKYANVSTQGTSFGQNNPINMNEALESSVFDSLYGENGILRGNPNPVQEIWFFNSSKEEIVKYVDTQIKNNTFYTYVVYAYLVVLESEYYYTNVGNAKMPCETRSLDFADEPVELEEVFRGPTEAGPARPVEVPPIESPVDIPNRPTRVSAEGVRGGPAGVPGVGLFGRR